MLSALFAVRLLEGKATSNSLALRLDSEPKVVEDDLDRLVKSGLVKRIGGGVELTPEGRRLIKVVFIGGGFEILHQGHLYTVEHARQLGDVLVVAVARDSTIRRRKGRDPVSGEEERVRLLSSMRQVDAAILGVEGVIYETLERVRPDIVALGYDQYHSEDEIVREGAKRGLSLKVVRLDSPHPLTKTSKLLTET